MNKRALLFNNKFITKANASRVIFYANTVIVTNDWYDMFPIFNKCLVSMDMNVSRTIYLFSEEKVEYFKDSGINSFRLNTNDRTSKIKEYGISWRSKNS